MREVGERASLTVENLVVEREVLVNFIIAQVLHVQSTCKQSMHTTPWLSMIMAPSRATLIVFLLLPLVLRFTAASNHDTRHLAAADTNVLTPDPHTAHQNNPKGT